MRRRASALPPVRGAHRSAAPTEKHYAAAIDRYTQAVQAAPSAVLYANRAAAHLSLENYGAALADAEKSLELDSSYVKARPRARGCPGRRRPDARVPRAGVFQTRRGALPAGQAGGCAEGLPCCALGAPAAYRRSCLLTASSFAQVAKMRPSDKDALAKVKECEKVVKELKFAAAIANPDDDEARAPVCAGGKPLCSQQLAACAEEYRRQHRPFRNGYARRLGQLPPAL